MKIKVKSIEIEVNKVMIQLGMNIFRVKCEHNELVITKIDEVANGFINEEAEDFLLSSSSANQIVIHLKSEDKLYIRTKNQWEHCKKFTIFLDDGTPFDFERHHCGIAIINPDLFSDLVARPNCKNVWKFYSVRS